ncbi:hypothetical protein [Rhodopseudomonas palustris]|uniref:hypothetical protein n=1 Tax=Rhodopseudomonas palustris TaxID=1076 RepID=UPI0011C38B01|nr:hypothetical protein [Rhodopseudomonas palustris]
MISRAVMTSMALIALGGTSDAASALAPKDPLWNSDHLALLPHDVQRAVSARCPSGAIAGHYFATYAPTTIVLHFEHLRCRDGSTALCNGRKCLRQVYRDVGGRYRLERSYFAAAYQ